MKDTPGRKRKFEVVGRYPDVDIKKYGTFVHGRWIIDYELLKRKDPALYEQVLIREHEAEYEDERRSEEIEEMIDSHSPNSNRAAPKRLSK